MFNLRRGFPFDVRLDPRINYDEPQAQVAAVKDGTLVVPASWRDDDDE